MAVRTEAGGPVAPGTPTIPKRGLAHDARAVFALWRREMRRIVRNRVELVFTVLSPLLFFVVLGVGIGAMLESTGGTQVYLTFLFPGILVFAVQAQALAAGISIVRDRETGLLRGMLVAPVRRGSLVVGKVLGGATASAAQAAVLLSLSGLVGFSYDPVVLVLMFLVLALISLCITTVGALCAVTVRRVQTFQAMIGVLLMPMYLLSGAMFAPAMLPQWLSPLVLVNPLTYAVDAMRRTAALGAQGEDELMTAAVTWGGWVPPVALEIVAMCGISGLALIVAARRFSRTG